MFAHHTYRIPPVTADDYRQLPALCRCEGAAIRRKFRVCTSNVPLPSPTTRRSRNAVSSYIQFKVRFLRAHMQLRRHSKGFEGSPVDYLRGIVQDTDF